MKMHEDYDMWRGAGYASPFDPAKDLEGDRPVRIRTIDPKDERIAYLERALEQATTVTHMTIKDGSIVRDGDKTLRYSAERLPDLARYLQEKQNG